MVKVNKTERQKKKKKRETAAMFVFSESSPQTYMQIALSSRGQRKRSSLIRNCRNLRNPTIYRVRLEISLLEFAVESYDGGREKIMKIKPPKRIEGWMTLERQTGHLHIS